MSASILLTHCHPEHAGSAAELSHLWNTPIYVHPDEMPLALDPSVSTVERYANPLDRSQSGQGVADMLRAFASRFAASERSS